MFTCVEWSELLILMVIVKVFCCCSLMFSSFSLTSDFLGKHGDSFFWIIGIVFLSFLLISNSAGLYTFSRGVAWYANRAEYGSSLLPRSAFIVLTPLTAAPLP